MKGLLAFLLAYGAPAYAAQIILPSTALERAGRITAIYRTNQLATGKGVLTVRWTDVYGRTVEDRKIPVELTDETDIGFPLDLRRAVAMKNDIRAHFSFEGVNKKGERDHREEDAAIAFIAKPPDRAWRDYAIIMWQRRTTEQMAKLKEIGINGGEYVGRNTDTPDFLLNNNMRWYAENIATDFYSEYHRWFPDRRVNWKFIETREEFKRDRSSKEPLKRKPSLSDPEWLEKIHDRLVRAARFWSPYRPFFYSLGDETGIADLAAFWDFDFSDQSLAGMRAWLRERYPTLQALNDQWGTRFTSWDSVIPQTTDEAMKQPGENFSSWSDFKEWMDVAYSRALRMGADAVRSVDPDAYVGIGGAQMPGWGGYDYSRITKALTAIEPYDIGANIEIIRSLNPDMAVLTTSFATGPWEQYRVWYELLHGNRGLIIWDDKSAFINPDGSLGPRARETAPYYTELRGGVAAQLINSRRIADPIAIHYSQPSMRIEWMLAQRPKGENWVTRNSSTEYRDSDFLRLRISYCKLLEDEGLQYNFVSYGQVEEGELVKRGYKVLILPRSTALSAREADQIRDFVSRGGVVIADGQPGVFDEHCKRLPRPLLADLFDVSGSGAFTMRPYELGKAVYINADVLNYHRNRLVSKEAPVHRMMSEILQQSGIRPQVAVSGADGRPVVGVEVHTFRNGGVTIVALLTNPQLHIEDLGPPEFRSNERFAKPFNVNVTVPAESYLYDMRAARPLGRRKSISLTVQPYEPVILSVSATPLPELAISAPRRIQRGSNLELAVGGTPPSPGAVHVIHIDVIDPSGKPVEYYSGNLLAPAGRASKTIPIAVSDPPGRWQVRARDLITGDSKTASFEVL
jgi:hypothetical protein